MKQINIYNLNNILTHSATLEDSEFQNWIDYQISNNSWGIADTYTVDIIDVSSSLKWDSVRKKRNGLISETDFIVMPDYPINSIKLAEFEAYRQELRNIPQNQNDPDNIIYPTKPL